MAAKAFGIPQRAVEEIFFQNDAVSICLLMNRRARIMRVIDFRAGPSSEKRMFVLSLAQREGIEKICTLVERDEVTTWVKSGFSKEGNIPGFYKRSDAFLLGLVVNPRDDAPAKSETRISLGTGSHSHSHSHPGLRPGTGSEKGDLADLDPAHAFAEKTIVNAKKQAKDLLDASLPAAKVASLKEADAVKAVIAAQRAGRALTAFEPFGRGDVTRSYFAISARGGFELVASLEAQACFGNAFLELLTAPRNEAEKLATASALRALCDKLHDSGVVSCFSLAPSDDVNLATAFVVNGFRRTGLLKSHIVVGGERRDAIIWSRKLANPADE